MCKQCVFKKLLSLWMTRKERGITQSPAPSLPKASPLPQSHASLAVAFLSICIRRTPTARF